MTVVDGSPQGPALTERRYKNSKARMVKTVRAFFQT
jgi:hypothetical protein